MVLKKCNGTSSDGKQKRIKEMTPNKKSHADFEPAYCNEYFKFVLTCRENLSHLKPMSFFRRPG